MKSKTYFILVIILLITIIIYFQYDTIKNSYYLNSLQKIKYTKTYRIDNGPYLLEDGTQIYEYNPSIFQLKNGDIIYTSRLSGHSLIQRKNKCETILKKGIYDEAINNAFSIFPKNIVKSCSHIIIKNNAKNETQIVPFTNKHLDNVTLKIGNYFGCEDPRIFDYNNKLWIYFHYLGRDNLNNKNKFSKYITIAPLDNLDNFIHLYTDKMKGTEKNWMPFEYENELYFEYSIQPHIILKAELDKNNIPTGYCPKVYNTKTKYSKKRHFGGGSPSIKIKLNGKYYFLGITHTRGISSTICVRKNLFYIFRAEPPFDILWIGPEFNMLNSPTNIEFATSLIVKNKKQTDNIEDYTVIVSYGIEDCCGFVNEYKLTDIIPNSFSVVSQNRPNIYLL